MKLVNRMVKSLLNYFEYRGWYYKIAITLAGKTCYFTRSMQVELARLHAYNCTWMHTLSPLTVSLHLSVTTEMFSGRVTHSLALFLSLFFRKVQLHVEQTFLIVFINWISTVDIFGIESHMTLFGREVTIPSLMCPWAKQNQLALSKNTDEVHAF